MLSKVASICECSSFRARNITLQALAAAWPSISLAVERHTFLLSGFLDAYSTTNSPKSIYCFQWLLNSCGIFIHQTEPFCPPANDNFPVGYSTYPAAFMRPHAEFEYWKRHSFLIQIMACGHTSLRNQNVYRTYLSGFYVGYMEPSSEGLGVPGCLMVRTQGESPQA